MARVILGNDGLLAPGRWRWLRALGWLVALTAIVAVAFNVVGNAALTVIPALSGEHFASRAAIPQSYKLIGTVLGVAAALAVYWGAVRYGERRQVAELELKRLPLEVLLGCAIGAATMTAVVGGLWLFGWVTITPQQVTSASRALRESIQAGGIEELMIRLIMFRLLWRAFGIWPAFVIAGSFFGVIHIFNPGGTALAALSIVAGEGVGFGLYLLTGRVWASIGAHFAWNFTQGWIFGAIVSGYTGISGGPMRLEPMSGVADTLSGGSFGPEGSISALLVSIIASGFVLTAAWRRGCFAAADEQTAAAQTSG